MKSQKLFPFRKQGRKHRITRIMTSFGNYFSVATNTSLTLPDINGSSQNSRQCLDTLDSKAGIFSNPAVVAGLSFAAGGIVLSPVIAFVYNWASKNIKVSSRRVGVKTNGI